MGECFLYGQGGSSGNDNVKIISGEYIPSSNVSNTATIQLSSNLNPDLIIIMAKEGPSAAGGTISSGLILIQYDVLNNDWILNYTKTSMSAIEHYTTLSENSPFDVVFDAESSILTITYTQAYSILPRDTTYSWLMLKGIEKTIEGSFSEP